MGMTGSEVMTMIFEIIGLLGLWVAGVWVPLWSK